MTPVENVELALQEVRAVLAAHDIVGYVVLTDGHGNSVLAFTPDASWSLLTYHADTQGVQIGLHLTQGDYSAEAMHRAQSSLHALLALELRAVQVARAATACANWVREEFDINIMRTSTTVRDIDTH